MIALAKRCFGNARTSNQWLQARSGNMGCRRQNVLLELWCKWFQWLALDPVPPILEAFNSFAINAVVGMK